MDTCKYKGKLENGTDYEIHSMTSFSGMSELAVIIESKPVAIISVSKRKNGAIDIKPLINTKTLLTGAKEDKSAKEIVRKPVTED